MLIISFLPVVLFAFCTVDCICPLGSFGIHRFGPDCGFMCHCKSNEQCNDSTGECSSGCASFWYGPGCQYRDIAEGEYSRHSDDLESPYERYSILAHDGNPETCSYTAEPNSRDNKIKPFWRVWLPTTERISELMILTKVEMLHHFQGFKVYVENVTDNERENNESKPSDRQECYTHEGDPPRNETIKVLCKNPVEGNQVRIELETVRSQLVLCDVKINGGRNLAFRRDISQTKAHTNNPAHLAVDGHEKQSTWTKCSFAGDLENPWLKLDIGKNALIWYIRIFPFKYLQTKNKESLRLQLTDDKTSLIEKTVDIYEQTQSANISLNTTVARYVTITKPGTNKRLQICEIKVFGNCLEDECGLDCSKTCHCKNTNIWDKMAGKCTLGCTEGWTGESCDQQSCGHCLDSNECDTSTGECRTGCQTGYNPPDCKKECRDGKYGQNCSNTCSDNCKSDGKCNNIDGRCVDGCKPGYQDGKCEQKCQNGKYGQHCLHKCPWNCNDGLCDNVDGECQRGCKPGFFGKKCDQNCDDGKYGQSCTETCSSNCKRDETCNKEDGRCPHGCKSGYVGEKCNQKCYKGMYGEECIETCGYCLAGAPCDHENGACLDGCVAGYHGQLCKSRCFDGHWGPNCKSVCGHCINSSACSIYTGTCQGECKPGWLPPLCIYAESQVEKDCQCVSVGTIVGPTVAVVATGVVVIIILQLVLKRRNSQKPENPVEVKDGTSAPDVNEYETVGPSRVDVGHEAQYTELLVINNRDETVVAGVE